MSWTLLREGLAARIATIDGLVVHEVAKDTYPDRNVAVVLPGEPLSEPTGHRGKVGYNTRVVVMCSRTDAKDAQRAVDEFIEFSGTKSVISAVTASKATGKLPVDGVAQADDTRWVRTVAYGPSADVEKRWQADLHFYSMVTA